MGLFTLLKNTFNFRFFRETVSGAFDSRFFSTLTATLVFIKFSLSKLLDSIFYSSH
jgi:hypothetical protein